MDAVGDDESKPAPRGDLVAKVQSTEDDLLIQLDLEAGSEHERRRARRHHLVLRTLAWLLVGLTAVLCVAGAAPFWLLDTIGLNSPGTIAGAQRGVAFGSALGLALVAAGLFRRVVMDRRAERLGRDARVLVGPRGVIIHHPGLLTNDLRVGWRVIRAVALDAGIDPDDDHGRRFALAGEVSGAYLVDPDEPSDADVALLSPTPCTPNLAMAFTQPITVRNPNAALTTRIFGPRGRNTPVVAPGEQERVFVLVMRVSDIQDARAAFLPSGRLRALRPEDLHPQG